MEYLIFNPIFWFICTISATTLGLILKSKRRQRDIQKGVEKALKNMEKKK